MSDEAKLPPQSIRALAARAQKLFAESAARDPLQSRGLRRAVRAEVAVAESVSFGGTNESVQLEVMPVRPSATVMAATAAVMDDASSALAKVSSGNASNVTDREFLALEAIVLLKGRPAMRYTNGRVQMPSGDDNERWMTFVATARSMINAASAKVGQVGIARPGGNPAIHVGTAWRLGEDLVVTNRHVVAELVADRTRPVEQWTLGEDKPGVVNFSVTDNASDVKRFPIAGLAYCAPEESVDFAVLRLERGNEALPAALPLDWSEQSAFAGEEIYIVGHPYRAYASEEVVTVFQRADGFKRCSPGLVTTLSQFERAFEHDCSTLGGNSGSCVLTVREHKVVGLHYGGRDVNEVTAMGEANLALGLALLGDHRAAQILKDGRVA
ncbi:MAG TPA: serine protease [Thermoanaerobaculia bacterium]|nr:serine protease [Thermoanaerobaculia bacterium]